MSNRLAAQLVLLNLNYLALYGSKFEFDFNKLNQFGQLVHLKLDIVNLFNIKVCKKINLLKLKVLAFHSPDWNLPLSIEYAQFNTLVFSVEPEEEPAGGEASRDQVDRDQHTRPKTTYF